jgi:hypothetical protein
VTAAQRAAIQHKIEEDRKKVMDTFSREDLMAGVSILRTIVDKGNASASVWFVRNGNYLFGYALKQYKDSIRFDEATLASSTR